jgi:hypothetical protein
MSSAACAGAAARVRAEARAPARARADTVLTDEDISDLLVENWARCTR